MTLYLNVLSFIQFKITDLIDILLVAFILFQFYKWLKGTAAVRIFIGLMILFVIWKAVSLFQLNMLNVILEQFLSVGVILLIVVFQPELRKFLLYLGNTEVLKWARFYIKGKNIPTDYAEDVEAITRACERMSASRTGALMVFARKNPLDEFLATGQEIDAVVSQELLENLFYKNSPLHDGAVIIANHRIAAARCILPVSEDESIPSDLGLRHRSAIGATTHTDAISVIVSEQTGHISWCKGGKLTRNISPSVLKQMMTDEIYAEREKKN